MKSIASVEYALETLGWGPYQTSVFWAAFNVSVTQSWFSSMVVASSVSLVIKSLAGLSNTVKSSVALTYGLGCLVGCTISGYYSDHSGRLRLLRLGALFSVLGALIAVVTPWLVFVVLGYFVMGMAAGMDMVVVNSYAIESFPPSRRSMVTLLSVAWSVGSATSYLIALGLVLIDFHYIPAWRVVLVLLAVINLFNFYHRLKLQESPVFLMQNKRLAEYQEIMNKISIQNGKEGQFDSSISEAMLEDDEVMEAKTGSFKQIVDKTYLKSTILLTLIFFEGSLCYNSLLHFMPEFLPTSTEVQLYCIVLAQQISGIPGKVLASKLVDSRLGRVGTTGVGFLASSLVLIPFILSTNLYMALFSTCLYYFCVNVAYSSLYTQAPELYGPEVRAASSGFLMGFSRVGTSFGPVVAAALYDLAGLVPTLIFIVVQYCLVGIASFALTETRLKSQKRD